MKDCNIRLIETKFVIKLHKISGQHILIPQRNIHNSLQMISNTVNEKIQNLNAYISSIIINTT